MSYPDIADIDQAKYDEYLEANGIAFVCPNLACDGRRGEKPHREMIDRHSRSYRIFDVSCGWCTKQMVAEDDYKPINTPAWLRSWLDNNRSQNTFHFQD